MIGSGLKKLAKEQGMRVAQGVAFGTLRGYATTLSEGMGFKTVAVTTKLEEEKKVILRDRLAERDLGKEFRVEQLQLCDDGVIVQFLDNPGTMKKICAFIDWFWPVLEEAGAGKADICTECGLPIGTDGVWKLVDEAAFHLHPACAQRMDRSIEIQEEQEKEDQQGSFGRGFVGALLGALVGAIVWALVLSIGYVAAIIGLLIFWLANKGYQLLGGPRGRKKIVALVVCIFLGVVIGTLLGEGMAVGQMILQGYLPGATLADIPALILAMAVEYPDYIRDMLLNMVMGLVFAYGGTWYDLYKESRMNRRTRVKHLK